MNEMEMVLKLKEAKARLATAKEAKTKAQTEYDRIESQLVEMLETTGKDATAKYAGIGFCSLKKPTLYASCRKEYEDKLFEFLRNHGMESLIKETVNSRSLSSFISDVILEGKEVPDFISYYMKNSLRFTPSTN